MPIGDNYSPIKKGTLINVIINQLPKSVDKKSLLVKDEKQFKCLLIFTNNAVKSEMITSLARPIIVGNLESATTPN